MPESFHRDWRPECVAQHVSATGKACASALRGRRLQPVRSWSRSTAPRRRWLSPSAACWPGCEGRPGTCRGLPQDPCRAHSYCHCTVLSVHFIKASVIVCVAFALYRVRGTARYWTWAKWLGWDWEITRWDHIASGRIEFPATALCNGPLDRETGGFVCRIMAVPVPLCGLHWGRRGLAGSHKFADTMDCVTFFGKSATLHESFRFLSLLRKPVQFGNAATIFFSFSIRYNPQK